MLLICSVNPDCLSRRQDTKNEGDIATDLGVEITKTTDGARKAVGQVTNNTILRSTNRPTFEVPLYKPLSVKESFETRFCVLYAAVSFAADLEALNYSATAAACCSPPALLILILLLVTCLLLLPATSLILLLL